MNEWKHDKNQIKKTLPEMILDLAFSNSFFEMHFLQNESRIDYLILNMQTQHKMQNKVGQTPPSC